MVAQEHIQAGVVYLNPALIIALPVTIPITLAAVWAHPPRTGGTGWAAFGYLAVVSMFLGFFAWYRGLAIGLWGAAIATSVAMGFEATALAFTVWRRLGIVMAIFAPLPGRVA